MILQIATYVVISGVVLIGLIGLFRLWFGFPARDTRDIVPYLRPIPSEELEALLDPLEEARLRERLPISEFRALQRKRIHLVLELLDRMTHNAYILIQWANRQIDSPDQESGYLCHEMYRRAVEVRAYVLLTRLKLGLWMLVRIHSWHLLPSPSLSDLRETVGIRGLEVYDRLKTIAAYMFLQGGYDDCEKLTESL
jgi:hypothetical protein